NATNSNNNTNQNLTAYNVSTTDGDNDNVKNIFNWYLNGTSITVLNMPFERINNTNTNNAWDYSGYGNNGSVSGATWNSSGGYDSKGAYQFDGVDDYVNATLNGLPATTSDIAVEFWAKVTDIQTDSIFVAAPDDTANRFNIHFPWENNIIYWDFGNIGGGGRLSTAWDGSWTNTMAHWVFISESGVGQKIYRNGVLIAEDSDTSSFSKGTKTLSIAKYTPLSNYWVGTLDEFHIYNRSLSAEQISALYQNRTDLIVSQETRGGETWYAEVTPNDGYEDGTTVQSNNLTIPYLGVENVTLNATSVNNYTSDNLTVNYTLTNGSNDATINWLLNGSSITVLNMPFDVKDDPTNDYSSFDNDGTNNGATWNSTGGYDGKGAYEFDGSDDYVEVADNNQFDTPKGTISLWFKPAETIDGSTVTHTLMGRREDGSNALILWFEASDGSIRWYYDTGGAGAEFDLQTTQTSWTAGTLYHVAVRWGVNGNKIYINGVGEASNADTTAVSLNRMLNIGRYDSTNPLPFNGTIDEVRIYNRSLSPEQILALYQNRTDLIVSNETSVSDTWKSCVTPNDGYEDGTQTCSNNLTIQTAFTPPTQTENYLANGGLGTNLSSHTSNTIQSLSNYVWHGLNKGKINWKVDLNFSNTNIGGDNDLDNDIEFGTRFVYVNSVTATAFANKVANITFEDVDCNLCDNKNIIYTSGTDSTLENIQANGQSCSLAGKCSSFSCDNPGGTGNCTFDVTSFSGYAAGGNANLTINDSAEGSYETVNTSINFFAYYLNSSSGAAIADASCNISFDDNPGTWYNMTWNGTGNSNYNYTKSFSSAANHTWNVTCAKTGYTTLTTNDTVEVRTNSLPEVPILLAPENNSTTTNRTPTLIWNNSVDNDNDVVTYNVIIDDDPTFNNPEVNISSITNTTADNTTYQVTTELEVDTTYFWKVRGNDSVGYGDYSETFNFTLESYIAISVIRDTVSFGTMNGSDTANTTNNDPWPFLVENAGNIYLNLTITGTQLFTQGGFPSEYFQFKIGENETSSYNTSLSTTTWTNITNTSSANDVLNLDWHAANDNFETDLKVVIPGDEGAGTKNSTITFTTN
ncbi:MAG: hypothetical protein KKH52_02485, partial [Nanoarchaeota archaeon]|nr:hypothetical protein [Nanoarchaeota archaeon]